MADGDVFVAIANPVRRAVLDALRDGPRPVHELAVAFPITRPAVSQHLKILREAGLVVDEQAGRERVYRLRAEPLREVEGWVAGYERFWRARLGALGDLLDAEAGG